MIILLLLLGIAAGVLAGLFGIGGGILFTPILFILFSQSGVSNPVLWTIASSLFCTFIAAGGSSIRQYRQDNFYAREGMIVGLMGAAGVSGGKLVVTSTFYSETEFVIFFSILLLYVSYMFYRRGNKKHAEISEHTERIGLGKAAVIGGAGGFVAALAGIGGGGVMVPIMNLYYKQSFKKAVSVSSWAIVFISLSGWIQLGLLETTGNVVTGFTWGYVDFGTALPLAAGGLLGGILGALLTVRINRRYLQYGFAILAVAMAVKLLTEVF